MAERGLREMDNDGGRPNVGSRAKPAYPFPGATERPDAALTVPGSADIGTLLR